MNKSTPISNIPPPTVIEILYGREKWCYPQYMYHSIVNVLRSCGVSRDKSYETGKWARNAEKGDNRTITDDTGDREISLKAVSMV